MPKQIEKRFQDLVNKGIVRKIRVPLPEGPMFAIPTKEYNKLTRLMQDHLKTKRIIRVSR